MTSTKNETRKTTIKGIIANPQTQTFEQFEIQTPYTRSTIKAAEMAREALEIAPEIMLSVTELVQEEITKTVYNPQLLFENCNAYYDSEEAAKADAEKANAECVPFTMYQYDAQVWTYDPESQEYATGSITDISPCKFTKVDARGFVRMSAEQFYNAQVIGIHNEERTQVNYWAVISAEQLEKCVK